MLSAASENNKFKPNSLGKKVAQVHIFSSPNPCKTINKKTTLNLLDSFVTSRTS